MNNNTPTEIAAAAARISELIRGADLTTPAQGLGRWKVRDIAAHLGGVHRWATRIVSTRSMNGPGFTASKLNGDALCDWFDAGAAEMVALFRATDQDEPCPNFNPGSAKVVSWWSRRQLHETTVHRWDVERALDALTPIDRDLAADGVDEFLEVFVRTRGKQTLIAPLVLATTQPEREWTVMPAEKPGRVDVASGRSADAAAELSGPADQLLLALWGRLTLTEASLAIGGDPEVAASLTGNP